MAAGENHIKKPETIITNDQWQLSLRNRIYGEIEHTHTNVFV